MRPWNLQNLYTLIGLIRSFSVPKTGKEERPEDSLIIVLQNEVLIIRGDKEEVVIMLFVVLYRIYIELENNEMKCQDESQCVVS